eukprot:3414326-Lingulodinium_polyedra.AAC.1
MLLERARPATRVPQLVGGQADAPLWAHGKDFGVWHGGVLSAAPGQKQSASTPIGRRPGAAAVYWGSVDLVGL